MRSPAGLAAAAATAALLACVVASARAAGPAAIDYRVRLVAPVDAAGAPTNRHATAGVPFRLRVELSTDRPAGVAAVSYDMFLPTDVSIPLRTERVRSGIVTSRCLRLCAVGWDTARSRSLSVYYTLVPPGPGEFIVAARLVSTNRADAVRGDNATTTTIVVDAARLQLGVPSLPGGAPLAGRVFTLLLPIRRRGVPVTPTAASCRARVGTRRLRGVAVLARGQVRCSWNVPSDGAGATLQTTVTAAAGSLYATAVWSYAIRESR